MQLSKSETSKAYEALGSGGGIPALESALREMGAPPAPALELEDFEVAGKQRVMVLDVTRARLVRCAARTRQHEGNLGYALSILCSCTFCSI